MATLSQVIAKHFIKYEITNGFVLIDIEDLELINKYTWHVNYNKAGNCYARTTIRVEGKQKKVFMHRLITGAKQGFDIDHINRNGLDNRKINLRLVTRSQNAMNSVSNKNTSSKYKGVTWKNNNNKWEVAITKLGQRYYLGLYQDEIQAAKVYDLKAKELFGKYALLNFPESEDKDES